MTSSKAWNLYVDASFSKKSDCMFCGFVVRLCFRHVIPKLIRHGRVATDAGTHFGRVSEPGWSHWQTRRGLDSYDFNRSMHGATLSREVSRLFAGVLNLSNVKAMLKWFWPKARFFAVDPLSVLSLCYSNHFLGSQPISVGVVFWPGGGRWLRPFQLSLVPGAMDCIKTAGTTASGRYLFPRQPLSQADCHKQKAEVVMVLQNYQQDQPMSRCASPDPWRVHPDLKGFPGHVGARLVVHANPVQRTFDVVHSSTQAPHPVNGKQHCEAEFEYCDFDYIIIILSMRQMLLQRCVHVFEVVAFAQLSAHGAVLIFLRRLDFSR